MEASDAVSHIRDGAGYHPNQGARTLHNLKLWLPEEHLHLISLRIPYFRNHLSINPLYANDV